MKLETPNYSKRSPIVNESGFNDSHATSFTPPAGPKLGSPQTTFNPGASSEILPGGAPKYVSPPGRRVQGKGLTNKRLTGTL